MTQWWIRVSVRLVIFGCVVVGGMVFGSIVGGLPALAEDKPAGHIGTLRGVVMDAEDTPAAGVTVRAWAHGPATYRWSRAAIKGCFDGTDGYREVGSATTDASGTWLIKGLETGEPFGVEASGPGHRRTRMPWRFAFGGEGRAIRLALEPTVALHGRLVDSSGKGVAGFVSTTTALTDRERRMQTTVWLMHTPRLATDADGAFTIHARAGASVTLHVSAPGLGRRHGVTATMPKLDSKPGTPRVDVAMRLATGSALTGVVRDEDGTPIAGAQIVAEVSPRTPGIGAVGGAGFALSDEKGRYRLEGLPGEILSLIVVAKDGYALAALPYNTGHMTGSLDLMSEAAVEVDITLHQGRTITGHVLDEQGAPLVGARVAFVRDSRFSNPLTRSPVFTDGTGAFRLAYLPFESGSVVAQSTTHILPQPAAVRSHGPRSPPRGHRVLALAPSTIEDVTLRLVLADSLVGRILDHAGAAVPSALVTLTVTSIGGSMRYHRCLSDGAGRFQFHGLPSQTHARVEIDADGFAKRTQDFTPEASAAATPPTITLARGGVITGRILDAEGRPSPGAPVRGAGSADVAFADDDGVYEIRRVPPGSHRLILANWQGQLAGPGQRVVTIAEGQRVEGIDFSLPPENTAAGTEVIEGTLVDAEGAAIGGVSVRIQGVEAPHHDTTTQSDAQGRFQFAKLLAGTYRIYVGPLTRRIPIVKTGTRDLRLVVPTTRTHLLVGEVRDPQGRLVPFGVVEGRYPGDGHGLRRFSAFLFGGRFRAAVPADIPSVTLSVRDPRDARGRPLGLRFKPRAGIPIGGVPAILTLREAAALTGIVSDPCGTPVPAYPLRLTLPSDPSYGGYGGHIVETDAAGRFVFQGLEPRAYQIQSEGLVGWSVPVPHLITAPRADLEIVVRRYKDIRGRLLNDAGSPLVGVRAWAQAQSRQAGRPAPTVARDGRRLAFATAHTDGEGRFTLKHLPPDFPYTVRFNLPAHLATTHFPPILTRVEAGGPEALITLKRGVSIVGRVEGPDGKGLPKLRLRCYGPPGPDGKRPESMSRGAYTDDEGHFRVGPLPTGARVTLSVALSSLQQRQGLPWLPLVLEDVHAGRTDVRIVMSPGVEIRGHVEGATAAELQGFSMNLRAPGNPRRHSVRFDGKSTAFAFTGLAPGPYELSPSGPGRSRLRLPAKTLVEAPSANVTLRAILRVPLRGRMTGFAPKGFSAQFLPDDGTRPRRGIPLKADGTFDFGTVENRPGVLLITSPAGTHVVCLSLTPSQARVAAKAVPTQRLEGRIEKLPGELRRSKILARRGPVTFPGTIAEDGVFSFQGLPPGEWHLEITTGRPFPGTFKPAKAARAGDLFVVLTWK